MQVWREIPANDPYTCAGETFCTGSDMIIWGWQDISISLNDGAAYASMTIPTTSICRLVWGSRRQSPVYMPLPVIFGRLAVQLKSLNAQLKNE
jgi:hypothetical protein